MDETDCPSGRGGQDRADTNLLQHLPEELGVGLIGTTHEVELVAQAADISSSLMPTGMCMPEMRIG